MKTVNEAQEIILRSISRLGVEDVPLMKALGRVLAEDVFSNRNHPPYDISAMDGYAVRFADVSGATRENPVVLKIVDDIRAGYQPRCGVGQGEASCIMTGAPVPVGADAVIRVEDTATSGDTVKIFAPWELGANIRLMGENLKTGDRVLADGAELGPAEVGILAMVKKKSVKVYRRPVVAVLSTGDELEGIDEPFDALKIPDANTYSIMAELQALGVEPVLLGIARDTREALEAKLREGLKYDALIISGGVAAGHHDFVRPCLKELAVEILFWRVALRPGHPFAFGKGTGGNGKETIVFGLPGNPVSSMVCFAEFISPAVRKMSGHKKLFRSTFKARLTKPVKDKKGRTHFMRVRVLETPDGFEVETTGSQGSGILMSMVEADGLMIVPAEADSIGAGETVTVQQLGSATFQDTPGF
jgi:molybdopterin molybdotransferase